jgi:hypothetical protein
MAAMSDRRPPEIELPPGNAAGTKPKGRLPKERARPSKSNAAPLRIKRHGQGVILPSCTTSRTGFTSTRCQTLPLV